MNVRQMIAALEKVQNKEQEVVIAIGQYNRVAPVAYTPITIHGTNVNDTWFGGAHDEIRIHTMLPNKDDSFMYTGIRAIK